jgi:hypothetical protein
MILHSVHAFCAYHVWELEQNKVLGNWWSPCELAYDDVPNQSAKEDMTQHLLKIGDQQDFDPIIFPII